MNNFLDLADLQREQVIELLALAERLAQKPEPQALAGKILGLLFFNPSLRTLASFQAAMARLGGNSFVISAGQGTWQLETRRGAVMNGAPAEHVREGVPVLAHYCDALGIRAFAGGVGPRGGSAAKRHSRKWSAWSTSRVINMESAANHPCQALADWKTLDDLTVPRNARSSCCRGSIIRARCRSRCRPPPCTWPRCAAWKWWCCGPKGSRCRPPSCRRPPPPPPPRGGSVRETTDRDDALTGAHVVYAKEWGSTSHYGNAEADARQRACARRLVRARHLVLARRGRLQAHALPAGAA